MRLNSFILVALCFLGQTILALAGNGNSLASYLDREDSRLHRFVLPNGLIGLVKEDHSAPVAAVQIWIRTGSIHEGKDLGAGLSHYLEHMVFKGTPTRGPADITRSITDAGGKINAYTTLDRTVFHTVLPSANWRTAVEILGDGVMNATFPEEEWEREKQVVVREMDMGKDDPGRRLYKLLSRTAYQVHPYRFPVIGYEDIFSKVTREDLVDYHHRRYLPDNMIVMVAGDVDHREVEDYVQTTFKDFQRRAAEPVIIPTEPPQMAPRFGRETGNFNISRMQCAFHTVPLSHEDTAALDVLASVVGHGRSSRLNRVLKEEAQLVHSINAWNYSPKLAGIFGVTADFDPENETALLDALYREIESWHSETFTEEEVQKARRQVLVGELSSLTTMEGQAENYASGEFFAGDPTYARQYIARIEAVEPEDLNRVARKYFTVNNRTTVILSPEQEEAAAAMDASTLDKPTVEKVLLSNGTPLIVREDRRLPFVHISIAMHGGLLVESNHNNGITQLIAQLITRGTEKYTEAEIAELVESRGGHLSGFAGRNSFGLSAKCLTEDTELFMDLAAECLLRPTFPVEELDKQRKVQLAQIQQQKEDPFKIGMIQLKADMYGNHSYRLNPIGTEASVMGIDRDLLAHHCSQLVRSDRMVISVFGDIDVETARELVEKRFRDVRPAVTQWDSNPPEKPIHTLESLQRQPREQSILLVGYPGLSVFDQRMEPASLIQDSLSGLSSELAFEVREKRGLVYYVGAFQRSGPEPGMFVLYAGTQEESVPEVRRLMEEQLTRIAEEGLSEEELSRAQEQQVASYHRSLQDNSGLAQSCALNELYGLGYDYDFSTEERVRAVTIADTRRTAGYLFETKSRPQVVSIVVPEVKEKEPEDE